MEPNKQSSKPVSTVQNYQQISKQKRPFWQTLLWVDGISIVGLFGFSYLMYLIIKTEIISIIIYIVFILYVVLALVSAILFLIRGPKKVIVRIGLAIIIIVFCYATINLLELGPGLKTWEPTATACTNDDQCIPSGCDSCDSNLELGLTLGCSPGIVCRCNENKGICEYASDCAPFRQCL